jgi:hypothetical protein
MAFAQTRVMSASRWLLEPEPKYVGIDNEATQLLWNHHHALGDEDRGIEANQPLGVVFKPEPRAKTPLVRGHVFVFPVSRVYASIERLRDGAFPANPGLAGEVASALQTRVFLGPLYACGSPSEAAREARLGACGHLTTVCHDKNAVEAIARGSE